MINQKERWDVIKKLIFESKYDTQCELGEEPSLQNSKPSAKYKNTNIKQQVLGGGWVGDEGTERGPGDQCCVGHWQVRKMSETDAFKYDPCLGMDQRMAMMILEEVGFQNKISTQGPVWETVPPSCGSLQRNSHRPH